MKTKNTLSHADNPSPFSAEIAANRYVAFVDILGFGKQVLENFDDIFETYQELVENITVLTGNPKDINFQILSDAFLVSSASFRALVKAIQALHMHTLFSNCLVRGGVGFGKHLQVNKDDNFYVLSQALVQAVQVEKNIKFPCVALHDSIEISKEWWNPNIHPTIRGLSYFEGIRLITPFNIMWGQSAKMRVSILADTYPEYRDKYNWFLRLYEATFSGDPLVPVKLSGSQGS